MKDYEIKTEVRKNYAAVAVGNSGSDCSPSCCGAIDIASQVSSKLGYSKDEIEGVPEGAIMGLGCGNPTAHAELKPGDYVLDLGAGGGFDCFLAAKKVGKEGKVIGVDMTPEMIAKARANTETEGYDNVEFRLGEIENLPAPDNFFDKVISNCVINLSTDKARVFNEIRRVLKPGGKFIISDIVLTQPLPEEILKSVSAYVSCIAGASLLEGYIDQIKEAGFNEVRILNKSEFSFDLIVSEPNLKDILGDQLASVLQNIGSNSPVVSITVSAVKD